MSSNSGPVGRNDPPQRGDSTSSLSEQERQELRMRYLGFEPRPWRPAVLAALIGVVAGALLTASFWLLVERGGDSDVRTVDSTTAGAAPTGTASAEPNSDPQELAGVVLGTEASAPRQPGPVEVCRQVVAAQEAPLKAAVPALSQWEVHVGAMNKLVVGAITLAQATAFWNQTRVGAARHVDDFLAAAGAYRRGGVGRCPQPDQVPVASTALHACAAAVAARNGTIRAAETSAKTWNKHVKDMEMLRMGHLSPAKATQMWLASWRAGQRQLDDYEAAVHAMHGRHC